MKTTQMVFGAAVVAGLVLGAAGPAGSSPKDGEPVTVQCGDEVYELVIVPGHGHWTPAHDTASNRVFHPTEFDGFTGSVIDPETGEVVDTFSEDFVDRRGASHDRLATHDCTFRIESMEDGYLFVGEGGVSGYFSGRS